MSKLLKFIAIAAVTMATTSCMLDLLFSGNRSLAEESVERFHSQYNAGRFEEIYNQADANLKEVNRREEFVALLQQVYGKLGAVRNKRQFSSHVNKSGGKTEVTLEYDVEYSQGKGKEKFVFYIVGDEVRLYNYTAKSPSLAAR